MSPAAISGVLNVDKPAGWTSFDVVGFVRRHSGVKRVGHTGTLDPMATGVLVLLLGHATRLSDYLMVQSKRYLATVELGIETDTYDREGRVVSEQDASCVTRSQIDARLSAFVGTYEQVPPLYSAIKRNGQALYKAARRGEAMEPPASRQVTVQSIEVVSYEPPFLTLDIECGKGFYVRSLAHDLGAVLGVSGTLSVLRRLRVGTFHIEDSVQLETLRGELADGTWQERLWAPDDVLLDWRAAVLGPGNTRRLINGLEPRIGIQPQTPGEPARAYTSDGDFVGVLRNDGLTWLPEKVFLPTG
jgi:tRNA pseudouridine55 synthase